MYSNISHLFNLSRTFKKKADFLPIFFSMSHIFDPVTNISKPLLLYIVIVVRTLSG